MIKKAGLFIAAVFMSLAACSGTKHVALPEILIEAPSKGKLARLDSLHRNRVYFGSYTTVNDIVHTKLDLKFNYDSAFVIGKAVVKFKPHFYPTDSLTLDAKGFRLNEVVLIMESGLKKNLKYTYDGEKLRVKLDKTYSRNEDYSLSIDYVAMPNKLKVGGSTAITSDKGLYFINPDGKEQGKPKQIWTQGETEANSAWFPTINGPQAKHTQEISLTVENKYVTLSNGLMTSSKVNVDGTRTDVWKQDKRHSTYLTMIAVGDFAIVKDKWRNLEVSYYVEPKYEQYAKMIFGNTPEMMEFYSRILGVDYVWDKYSQIVVRDFVSGAMENTTATVHFDRLQMDDRQYLDETHEDIIAHELFHHWFGDLVTCESWPNLPLNESFATYGEYLWYEHKYGRAEADLKSQMDMINYLSSKGDAEKELIRFEISDRESMFDLVSYQKGGRILHMLRKYVGDEAFFASLKLYLEDHKFQTAEVHDLRIAFEKTTGEDLNWFFNQWFLNSGSPELSVATFYNSEVKQIEINVAQLQNTGKAPIYKLPIDVDIYSGGQKIRKRVVVDQPSQKLLIPFDQKPELVMFDAEQMLLGTVRETKTREEWVRQFRQASLVMDRIDALNNLGYQLTYPEVQQVFKDAVKDESWGVRMLALQSMEGLPVNVKDEFYALAVEAATNDKKSYVRGVALGVLSKTFNSKDNKAVFAAAANDKSPMVEQIAKQIME